ncbi:MAG: hypothetical protein R2865_03110 [Deinococcales bacterium]
MSYILSAFILLGVISCQVALLSLSMAAIPYNGMRDNLPSTCFNLQELIRQLSVDKQHLRTYYYNALLTEDHGADLREGQQRFLNLCVAFSVTVRLGRLHRRNDGSLVASGYRCGYQCGSAHS